MAVAFNRNVSFGGSFAADQAILNLPPQISAVGMIVQRFGLRYSQRVQRFWDLTSNAIYYIGGRTEGMTTMANIVGPKQVNVAMYTTIGDMCQVSKNILSFGLGKKGQAPDCLAQVQTSYKTSFCLLTDISIDATTDNSIINDSPQIMFGMLEIN